MKRWSIRLLALGIVIGLGYFTVTWAQQNWGSEKVAGPDFSKPPVNADTIDPAPDAKTGATRIVAQGGDRRTADPFQNITQAAAQTEVTPSSRGAGRYGTAEPRVLDADPNAAPLALEQPVTRANALRGDDIPSANDVGAGAAKPAQFENAASDPFNLPGAGPATTVTNNSMAAADSADASARYTGDTQRQTAGATPGSLEPVNNPRSQSQVVPVAGNDRYGNFSSGNSTNGGVGANASANDYSPANYGNNSYGAAAAELGAAAATAATAAASSRGAQGQVASQGQGFSQNQGFPQSPNYASNQNSGAVDNYRGSANTRVAQNPNAARGNAPYGGSTNMGSGALSNDSSTATQASAVNVEGMSRPGEKRLEGAQNPSVTIEKIAPPEIQVNKPATFQIVVRNTGPVIAENVEVTDVVPEGTEFIDSTPRTIRGQRGDILWKVGDLKPGEEAKLAVNLMPLTEGEIGSMAVVQFRTTASMRTIATKPEIVMELTAPKQVMIGDEAQMRIKLSNPGTGAASKVTLQAKLPDGFQHPAGKELEFEVGQFRPGETRELDLTLKAVAAGAFNIALAAQGDAQIHTEKVAPIEVIAPGMQLALNGPNMRYLERQAKYTVTVTNPGTASARDINLVTRLPKGMQFVEASDSGRFDAASNSVLWALDELPAKATAGVTLTALAKDLGQQKLRSEVKAAGGLSETMEQVTMVEGMSAIMFTVADVEDPVEIGGKATYEIRVVNQGSKAAENLQLMATFPPEIQPVNGEGPSRHKIDGQRILFDPMQRLGPKADVTYRVVGQCLRPGDARLRVDVKTNEMENPVVKEESTRVYKD